MKISFFNWQMGVINAYYNRINIHEGIYFKSNNSKECVTCHYWFFNHGFEFKDSVYNDCHDLTMLCLSISNTAIIFVKGVDYCRNIHDISKSEAIYLLENSV